MCVCLSVYGLVCMYVHMSRWVSMYVCACTFLQEHVCVCVCLHVCERLCACVSWHICYY